MDERMTTSHDLTPFYAASAAVAVTAAVLLWKRYRQQDDDGSMRKWSYTSHAMAIGTFPESSQIPDPVINAVLLFEKCPTMDAIIDEVVVKMLHYERLNSIYDSASGKPRPCKDLDPHDMVREVTFKGTDGGESELIAVVQRHIHDPLSENPRGHILPWWEFLILRNTGKGLSAVVWRSHHSLADGLSMVNIAEDIITDMEGNKVLSILPRGIQNKFKIQRTFLDTVQGLAKGVGEFGYMLNGPYDDSTAFSQPRTVHTRNRSILCFEPMPLEFIKKLKNAAGVSLNDIIYTCFSQAIHDLLVEQDDPVLKEKGASLLCRSLMPLGIPSREKKIDKTRVLRNNWCFLSADLAVGIDDIQERLNHVHKSLMKLKQSLLPVVILGSQNYVCPYLPTSFNRKQVRDLLARHSVVFSNVPGPSMPCAFAGHQVVGVQMVYSNLIPQIGILSYSGNIFGNLCINTDEVPNSERIPILMSKALVSLASRLDVSIPESIRNHADSKIY